MAKIIEKYAELRVTRQSVLPVTREEAKEVEQLRLGRDFAAEKYERYLDKLEAKYADRMKEMGFIIEGGEVS